VGDSFTHLHLHTEFSMLDGAARVSEVIAAAAAALGNGEEEAAEAAWEQGIRALSG
jgi:hypothetical protein